MASPLPPLTYSSGAATTSARWAIVKERDYEGLVAKDRASGYRGGPTRSWQCSQTRQMPDRPSQSACGSASRSFYGCTRLGMLIQDSLGGLGTEVWTRYDLESLADCHGTGAATASGETLKDAPNRAVPNRPHGYGMVSRR
jgi:hypothetical protein